jgi:hypothetical protein
MDDGFQINGREGSNVFVNRYDEGVVWLSLYIRHGSISTLLTHEQAKELIAALQQVVTA